MLYDEFLEEYLTGDEDELKRGNRFKRDCLINAISIHGAYCPDSNSIWLNQDSVDNAVLGVLSSRYKPDDYNPWQNGHWKDFFEGFGNEFGHFLYAEEFRTISDRDFVNHKNSKAHLLGSRISEEKSDDVGYVNWFFFFTYSKKLIYILFFFIFREANFSSTFWSGHIFYLIETFIN